MSTKLQELRRVSDGALIHGLETLIDMGRRSCSDEIAHIAEMERRRLHRGAGYSSMHEYCVRRLHLSEHEAFTRIRAARAARRFPRVLDMIEGGQLHLTGIVSLYPQLVRGHGELLEAAVHKTRREIEHLLAERFPQPDVPTAITPIAAPPAMSGQCPKLAPALVDLSAKSSEAVQLSSAEASLPAPVVIAAPSTRVAPLAPERFALQTTISKKAHDLLRRAQELLGHQVSSNDVAAVLERALQELVARLEKQKFAATECPRPARRPKPGSRHIPAAVRREVRKRDDDQCTFVGRDQHRCQERRGLQLDHVTPFARGGRATVSNIRLRCHAHNQYEAERAFGEGFMETKRGLAAVARGLADGGRAASSTT